MNSTANQGFELFAVHLPSLKYLKTLVYAAIMLFSLLGNTAVIVIVLKNKRMRTVTNYLIVNMAVSDLLISAFAVPRELTEIYAGPRRWLLDGLVGLILCKLLIKFLILLPLCVIFSLYALIVLELKKRQPAGSRASVLSNQRRREDGAVMKKILYIVFLFIFCIAPITIAALLFYFVWDWHIPCGMDKYFKQRSPFSTRMRL